MEWATWGPSNWLMLEGGSGQKAGRMSNHSQVPEIITVTGLRLGQSATFYEASSHPLPHLRASMERGGSMALGSSPPDLEPRSPTCSLWGPEPIT